MRWIVVTLLVIAACKKHDDAKVRESIRLWDAARACFLGEIEYGPDAVTANAVAELDHEICPAEYIGLTHFVVTNLEAIPGGEQLYSDALGVRRPLEAGIAKVEARANEHRKLVGMPPAERRRATLGPALVAGPVIPRW